MTEKITEKNKFSMWDYPQLITYLETKARDGWVLVNYHEKTLEFEKSESKQLKFAVSFFPEYVAGATETPEKLLKMWDFAAVDGWQHITGNYHTQVFYNENPCCPSLHTDAVVQLENYNAAIRKQYLKRWKVCAAVSGGAYLVFTAFLLAEMLKYSSTQYMTYELWALMGMKNIFQIYTLGELIYNLVKIARYKRWYKRSLDAAGDNNNFIPLRAFDFSDKLNLGISIGVILGIIMQASTFLGMSWMKTAWEAVLNR